MSLYNDKARELGNLILASEESLRLADARAAYNENPDAIGRLEAYNACREQLQSVMEDGTVEQERFRAAAARLAKMGAELKADPVTGGLLRAESEFNTLVNGVIAVLRATITGVDGTEEGCGGNCGGCRGCH